MTRVSLETEKKLKSALADGELSDWAKVRIKKYLKQGADGRISQEEIERLLL